MFKKISITDFFFYTFPATAGGFLGSLIFLGIFFIFQSLSFENSDNQAFVNFVILTIIFCGALCSNILATFFIMIANNDKFISKRPVLINVFVATLILFFLTIPFLIVVENKLPIACLFFIFSILTSLFFLEEFSADRSIFNFYGIFIGAFILLLTFLKFFNFNSNESLLILFLFSFPITWFFLTSFASCCRMINPNFFK